MGAPYRPPGARVSASPASLSAAVPDALCPPVVVFARHRLRDEAWRRTTLAAVAATELAARIGRLALACADRLRRDPTSDDLDAALVALGQLGSEPIDAQLAAVRALIDRLEGPVR
jgi:hypothetical protein